MFVGGLDPNLSEDKIREYFGRYGKVMMIHRVDIVFIAHYRLSVPGMALK